MITPNTHHDIDPIAALAASISRQRELATQARADLIAATPTLIDALRHGSGQSRKIENLLWSCWSDTHQVNLCDALAGLDACLAQAVVAMISARTYLGGDADKIIRTIIDKSASLPPPEPLPA